MDKTGKTSGNDMEWESRVPCGDGNCIGTLGPDGRCRVCGIALEKGKIDESDFSAPSEAADGYECTGHVDFTADAFDRPAGDENSVDAWEDRVLCTDENCIGVMGPDGTCNVCKKTGR